MRKENKKSRNKGLKGKKRGGKRKHRKPGLKEIKKSDEAHSFLFHSKGKP